MKAYMIIVFFSIVFLIYFLVNYYIYRHGLLVFPKATAARHYFTIAFWAIVLCFPLGRIIERFWISDLTSVIIWIGSFWLAIMLYAFILVLAVDILRLSNLIYPWFNQLAGTDPVKVKHWIFYAGLASVLTVVLIGHINAVWTRVSHYDIKIAKHGGNLKKIRIVAASDIHMGTIISKHRVTRLVNLINSQHPDLVLFAGDLLDEDLAPVIRRNLGQKLEQISSKYGIAAILGNHEYIGGSAPAAEYMKNHGITVLKDSHILIDSSLYVVGRDDRDGKRYSGTPRKEVSELVKDLDSQLPIVLLDHQPYQLDKAEKAGIDIQLSGHTHHGQLWPISYVTEAIFELSSGYLVKGNTHFFVSNGYGSWGPPVRIGNRPEIIVLDVELTN